MVSSKTLTLYGAPAAIGQALVLLENEPVIRRVTPGGMHGEVRLLLQAPLPEGVLVPLLRQSGISGFRVHI